MRKLIFSMLCGLVAVAMSACGALNSEVAAVAEPEKKATVQIEGMAAEDFYAQFQFKQVGTCGQSVLFYAAAPMSIMVPDSPASALPFGRAELILYIMPGGMYLAAYKVIDSRYDLQDSKRIEGRWHIEGAEIVLDNIGRGRGITQYGEQMIEIKMNSKNTAPAFDGREVTISQVAGQETEVAELNCKELLASASASR